MSNYHQQITSIKCIKERDEAVFGGPHEPKIQHRTITTLPQLRTK